MIRLVNIILLTFLSANIAAEGTDAEKRLLEFLQSKIHKFSPPREMLNNTVGFYADLYQLLDVDEKNGLLTIKLWIYYYYYVTSANWNPEDYDGILTISVPADTFWRPDIVALDATEVKYESFNRQTVYSTRGFVSGWSSLITMKVSCNFNVSFFPFDSQYCPVTFGQWIYDHRVYRLGLSNLSTAHGATEEAPLTHFTDHNEWALDRPLLVTLGVQQLYLYEYDYVTLHIRINRLSHFYSVVLVFPHITLYLLSVLVFLTPVGCGEKISLSVTLLLAQVVTFGTLADILPASSDTFPIIGYFMSAVVAQMSAGCVIVVIIINIHHMGNTVKMGNRLKSFLTCRAMYFFLLRPYSMRYKKIPSLQKEPRQETEQTTELDKRGVATIEIDKAKEEVANSESETQNPNPIRQKWVSAGTKIIKARKVERTQKESWDMARVVEKVLQMEKAVENKELWEYFALVLDRLCMYIHIGLTVAFFTAFIKKLSHS